MVKQKLYLLIFVLISSFSLAQKATTINVNNKDIKTMKLLSDLIKDIPADCNVKSYSLSLVMRGMEKSMIVPGPKLESFLNGLAAGEKFFIEKIQSDCKGKHKQKYKIVVE